MYLTPPAGSSHQIKRKPPPPIDDDLCSPNLRYPSPDPADPLASLAQLRARKRTSNSSVSSASGTSDEGMVHIIHGDDDSVWYEMYPSSPTSYGYMPSHLDRDSPNSKSTVSRSHSLDRSKRRSHYRPHSLTVKETRERAISPPLLLSDSDDTSSDGRSWEDSSMLSGPHGFDADHHRISNFTHSYHDREAPILQDVPKSAKHKKRNPKRSSVASSTISYMSVSATLATEIENHPQRSPAPTRPHPFASSLHLVRWQNSEHAQEFTIKSGAEPFVLTGEKSPTTSDFGTPQRLQIPKHSRSTSKRDRKPLTPVSELPLAMKIPSVFDLNYAASCEVVAENGLSVPFGDLCTSSKTIVCFIRHFWCQRSQEFIASLCRELDIETLKRGDARLVVISPGSPKVIKSYRSMFHAGLEVYCDTSLRLYETFGMRSLEQSHKTQAKHVLIRNLLRVIRLSKNNAGNRDRLGGEFVFTGSGLRCCYAHRMAAIGDHPPVSELLKISGMGSIPCQPSSSKRHFLRAIPKSFLQLSEPRTVST